MNRIYFGITTNLQEFVRNNIKLNSQLHKSSSNKKVIKKRTKKTSKLNEGGISLEADLSSDIGDYEGFSDSRGRSKDFEKEKKKKSKEKKSKQKKTEKDNSQDRKEDNQKKKNSIKEELIEEINNDMNLLADSESIVIINPNVKNKDLSFDDLVEYVQTQKDIEAGSDLSIEQNKDKEKIEDIREEIVNLENEQAKAYFILDKLVFCKDLQIRREFLYKLMNISLELALKLYDNNTKFFILDKESIKERYNSNLELGYSYRKKEFFISIDLLKKNYNYAFYLFALSYDLIMGHNRFSSKKAPVVVNAYKRAKEGYNYFLDSLSKENIVHYFATSVMAYFTVQQFNKSFHWEVFKDELIQLDYDIYAYLSYLFKRASKRGR